MLHERVHLFTCHFVLSFYWLVVGLCWKPRILEAYTNAWQDILLQVMGAGFIIRFLFYIHHQQKLNLKIKYAWLTGWTLLSVPSASLDFFFTNSTDYDWVLSWSVCSRWSSICSKLSNR